MKKIILFSLALLSVASVTFYGCKKGPEDPFISFKSRKARVTGKWKVTEYTVNGADSTKRVRTFEGNLAPCGDFITTITDSWETIFDFNKNGSFSLTTNYGYSSSTHWKFPPTTESCSDGSISVPDSVITVTKGLWQFAGGVGAYKSKEQIVLTDGEDHVFGTTYDIVECKTKELKLQVSTTSTDTLTLGKVIIEKWTLQPFSE